jgi:hypothetical protein
MLKTKVFDGLGKRGVKIEVCEIHEGKGKGLPSLRSGFLSHPSEIEIRFSISRI